MSDYPQHDKLRAIRNESQAIGDFLSWLENGNLDDKDNTYGSVELAYREKIYNDEAGPCPERSEYLTPLQMRKKTLLAKYFGIDLDKLEDEKLAMIDLLRDDSNVKQT